MNENGYRLDEKEMDGIIKERKGRDEMREERMKK